ncbi:hypothetical protein [Brevundimonas sp.]|uniref:hypothetical protein n=1 Tax=Brevundimonas sp. TaxID=1871086 RepID=UPI002898C0B1|nr:hypothetical protein [Brevundimonas sp.]
MLAFSLWRTFTAPAGSPTITIFDSTGQSVTITEDVVLTKVEVDGKTMVAIHSPGTTVDANGIPSA